MTFEDWNLFDNSPAWRAVTMGTPAERKAKMETPSLRDAIRAEYDAGIMPGVGDRLIDDFVVHEVVRPEFEKYLGLRVAQIAEDEGKHVVDVLLDITIGDDLKTEFSRPLRTKPGVRHRDQPVAIRRRRGFGWWRPCQVPLAGRLHHGPAHVAGARRGAG